MIAGGGTVELGPLLNGRPTHFQIMSAGEPFEPLVKISMQDGSITYGPHYTPDVAAQTFWEAVSAEYRDYLAWKKRECAK